MMNTEDKLEGMLLKCSGGGLDVEGRVGLGTGTGLVVMTLGERSLVNHPILAEDDDEDDEDDEDLTGSSLVTHDLVPPEQLMMQEEDLSKSGVDEETESDSQFPLKLTNKLPCLLHMPLTIKQEMKLTEPSLSLKKDKKAVKDLTSPKKKKRKQRSPAKILAVSEDGSVGMQSPKCHVCIHCNAAFRTNYHLQRHVFIHTGEKPFQCTQCDMRFIQKYLLQRHEKIHTGEKPFRCDECGMRFIQKYHMERHKRTHSGEKPYQCDYCHQYFSRTDRVLKHRRMCHENKEKKNKSAGKVGPPREPDSLNVPFLAKECTLPKKKRQKCTDKALTPDTITVTQTEGHAVTVTEVEEKQEQIENKIEDLPLYAVSSKVKHEYIMADYSMHLTEESTGQNQDHDEEDTTPTKLVLKKISKSLNKQSNDHSTTTLLFSKEDNADKIQYAFEIVDKQNLLDVDSNTELESVETLQGGPAKPAPCSTNYDDAMQFLKKKRYLQAATINNSRDYNLSSNMSSQTPVSQTVVSTVIDETVPATILEPQPLNTDIKSHEKSVLPDEVLQTLLDHYSNKANGFSVADTEVTSSISINSSDVSDSSPVESLAPSSAHAQPTEKISLLQEYSKFLQQALERTSQNDSYLTSQSLSLVSESPPLAGQPLFATEKQFPSPSRFKSGMNSPLRSSLDKPHFGLLVGDSQHSFSFSGDETTPPSAVSPTDDDFLEQVSPKKSDSTQGILQTFQISSFDQNFKSHFQTSRSGSTSQFTVANGQVSLRGHGTDFSEFTLVRETRSQLNSSPDVSSSETF